MVNFLKRDKAILVLKELLETCVGLDGQYLELSAPCRSTKILGGYQIVIHATLDKKTKDQIEKILTKHQLTHQEGNLWKTKHGKTEPDTFIIFKTTPKNHN